MAAIDDDADHVAASISAMSLDDVLPTGKSAFRSFIAASSRRPFF
jgi:hypothetical protein